MRTSEKLQKEKVTAQERITHERTGHAMYDSRCETCLKVRGVTTHTRRAVAEAAYFDYAVVKNSQQGAEVKILVGAGPRGETVARAVQTCSTLACRVTRRSECHWYSTSTICCWLERARLSKKSSPS